MNMVSEQKILGCISSRLASLLDINGRASQWWTSIYLIQSLQASYCMPLTPCLSFPSAPFLAQDTRKATPLPLVPDPFHVASLSPTLTPQYPQPTQGCVSHLFDHSLLKQPCYPCPGRSPPFSSQQLASWTC